MDVLDDILPSAYAMRAEVVPKDRQQRNKNHNAKKLNNAQPVQREESESAKARTTSKWNEEDRRSGDDRRQRRVDRGRFLESRAEKDRRQRSNALFLKI